MAGYSIYLALRELEILASSVGFKLAYPSNRADESIALHTVEEKIPLYDDGTSLYVGDHIEVWAFLQGIQWARKYDSRLKVTNDEVRKKREKKYVEEMNEINRKLEEKRTFELLKKEY